MQVIVGDWAGRTVAESQPVKLAALEGLPRTTKGAPFTLGGFYDRTRGEVRCGIEVPKLLSLLAKHDPNATVTGLDSVPREPTARRSTSCASRSRRWSGSARRSALLGVVFVVTLVAQAAAAATRRGSTAR